MVEEAFRQTRDLKNGILNFTNRNMRIALVVTFQSMRTSWSFFKWRGLLNKFHVDTSSFIERQLQVRSTDLHKGWSSQTLMALFDYDFEPVNGYGNNFARCQYPLLASQLKETWWCKNVEKIRRGLTPDLQPMKIFWTESNDSFECYSARVVDEEMIGVMDPHFSGPCALKPDQHFNLPSESLPEGEE